MKKIIFILCLIYTNFVYANNYIETKVNWHTFKVIEYDKTSILYDIQVFKTPDGVEKPLKEILKENNAISWVNWVFFCPSDYSFCADRIWTTNNERYVKWVKYSAYDDTWDRVVFAIDQNRNSFLFQTNTINPEMENQIYYWLSNRPLLLKDGEQQTEAYWDKWLVDWKMTTSATRNFICNNKDNTKIYFWLVYWLNIDELAITLKDFGCYNALNLDAGASTAFIYNWKYLVWPQRNIIDAVWIVPKFDLSSLDYFAIQIIEKLNKNISKKTILKQKESIEKYTKLFNDYKQKVYEQYSVDIIWIDENWNEFKNWYKIEINNQKWLKIIYILNQVLDSLKDQLNELNKQIRKEELEKASEVESLKID